MILRRSRTGRLAAPLFVCLATAAGAQEIVLGSPVRCRAEDRCYIQQYVDRDAAPLAVRDVGCGTLANDGHKGTDFAVGALAAMERGVPVVAAAAGTVKGWRDGEPDIATDAPGAPDVTGKECGNGVVLAHPGGWETQYCHLRKGSVAVSLGQEVAEGDALGLVGLSGLASFPHVHLSVRRDGATVDPFRPDAAGCGPGGPAPLWRDPPRYRPGGVISAGLLDRVPDFAEVEAGLPVDGVERADAPLVLWAYVFAGRAGDQITLSIQGPGTPVGAQTMTLEKDQVQLFRAWGRRAPAGGWAEGDYTATIVLRRGGQVLDTARLLARLP